MSGMTFDFAVTLCDNAYQICPVVTGAKKTINHGFPNPTVTSGSDKEVLEDYRNVRDMITVWIDTTFGTTTP
jgi:arsenate reductase